MPSTPSDKSKTPKPFADPDLAYSREGCLKVPKSYINTARSAVVAIGTLAEWSGTGGVRLKRMRLMRSMDGRLYLGGGRYTSTMLT